MASVIPERTEKTMDDTMSPYRSPSAEVGGVSGDSTDLMSAFLGPKNTAYYLQRFEGFKSGGGALSWNWPACLITWFWLAYRKMWAWFFIYWLVWPFVVLLSAAVAGFVHESLVIIVYFAGYFIVPPLIANRLYYRQALNKLGRAHHASSDETGQALEAARLGGTSNVVIILIPAMVIIIGILAAIAIPAYQDYGVRAQVSEGLSLSGGPKAAVTEYYLDTRSAPADNEEAGLPDAMSISGQYVESVAVYDGEIIVTYGNDAKSHISGEELHLTPSLNDGQVTWSCSSPSIAAKNLPSACR